MKACNVYIISLDDEMQHRIAVRGTCEVIGELVLEEGEVYVPRMFFIDEATEEALLEVINGSKYGQPDIIISIGLSITLCLAELYKKIEPISTIFTGIYDPVAYNIVQSLERPGGCMSGVRFELSDSDEFIRQNFKVLVPAIETIFMPYDTRLDQLNFSIKRAAEGVAKIFESLGCKVVLQAVSGRDQAIQAVQDNMRTTHAVADFGLHIDTTRDVAYVCGMNKRIFISQYGEFGFQHGASLTVMPKDPNLLYQSMVQMLRNVWWHRKNIGTQAIVTVYEEPGHVVLNTFILPYWAFDLLFPLLKNHPEIICKNCWISPPV
jgi:hypothetical protein